jgi:hypothetical protein
VIVLRKATIFWVAVEIPQPGMQTMDLSDGRILMWEMIVMG